jgi:hypothetical protein
VRRNIAHDFEMSNKKMSAGVKFSRPSEREKIGGARPARV